MLLWRGGLGRRSRGREYGCRGRLVSGLDAADDAFLGAAVVGHEGVALAELGVGFPKEEVAFIGVAGVELAAFVGGIFLHGKAGGGFVTVAWF